MEINKLDGICETIDRFTKDKRTALMKDQDLEYLKEVCDQAREYAEKGNYEEAHRLLHVARDLLVAEGEISKSGGGE